jgi:hypothetical protein
MTGIHGWHGLSYGSKAVARISLNRAGCSKSVPASRRLPLPGLLFGGVGGIDQGGEFRGLSGGLCLAGVLKKHVRWPRAGGHTFPFAVDIFGPSKCLIEAHATGSSRPTSLKRIPTNVPYYSAFDGPPACASPPGDAVPVSDCSQAPFDETAGSVSSKGPFLTRAADWSDRLV